MSLNHIINLFTSHSKLSDEFRIQGIRFKKLSGDVSYKIFYRVTTADTSFILIKIPTHGLASQEIFSLANQLAISPAINFIEAALTLEKHSSNIARIYAHDINNGVILLADHGDMILEELIKSKVLSTEKFDFYFRSLFSWILELQSMNTDFIGGQRQFCREAILSELQEFFDYVLCRDEEHHLDTDAQTKILNSFEQLADNIAALPQTLIHRDLQAKNIMIEKDKVWIIDFQDICIGPYLYDLASCIFDPYLNLPLSQQLELANSYWQIIPLSKQQDFNRFISDLTLIAIQRLLKCAGRFSRIYHVSGRDSHMQYVAPAINKAIELLRFHPEYPTTLIMSS